MIDPLKPFLDARGVAILDGGLATELERRGLSLDDPLWSARALLEAPGLVAAVHRDYLEAGADVITTATYQASLPGLAARGLTTSEAENILLSAVTIARTERDARRRDALVAASVGSYGAFLADGSEYRGDYGLSAEALAAWHRPRLRLLESSGAELIAFETIPSLPEVEAIAALLAECDGPPAWISFQAKDQEHLADGVPIDAAAAIADRVLRIIAIGVNCVAPSLVTPLLARIATTTAKPLVAYPSRDDTWDAALAPQWRGAGARLIGGCCRTTPADIRALAVSIH
jgi:homocysteine S-methyltransferase